MVFVFPDNRRDVLSMATNGSIMFSRYIMCKIFYLIIYHLLDPLTCPGIGVIIVSIPMTSRISMYMKSLQQKLSKIRDERIKFTNEILAGMKVIKLQAWEKEFQNRIIEVRNKELAVFRQYAYTQSFAGMVGTSVPLLVSIATFVTFVSIGNKLDVATALTALALFEVLRFPLFMLPQVRSCWFISLTFPLYSIILGN